MMQTFTFSGQLVRTPFHGRPSRATATMLPLITPDDYASVVRLPVQTFSTPVLCSFQEKYQLLDQLIAEAFARLKPLDRCLMTAMMPGGVRLPERLLDSNVFLVHQLEPEYGKACAAGYSVLAVQESLARHPMERNGNEIHLKWHRQATSRDDEGWNGLKGVLVSCGFQERVQD